jgi:hypothetical protein
MAPMIRVARLFMKTRPKARSPRSTSPPHSEVEGVTGRYYVNRNPKASSKASGSPASASPT